MSPLRTRLLTRTFVAALTLLGACCCLDGDRVIVREVQVGFESSPAGKAPAGFESARTGPGRLGRWEVAQVEGAPSGAHVLAQLDADATDARYPLLVRADFVARDVRAAVRFQARAGDVDQAAGLVVRFRDADNYYIARANALEDNVRLYRVVNGRREQLASADVRVAPRQWHALTLEARGAELRVTFDGSELLTARDTTFGDAGRAGVWTKADSVTWFDDLVLSNLDAR